MSSSNAISFYSNALSEEIKPLYPKIKLDGAKVKYDELREKYNKLQNWAKQLVHDLENERNLTIENTRRINSDWEKKIADIQKDTKYKTKNVDLKKINQFEKTISDKDIEIKDLRRQIDEMKAAEKQKTDDLLQQLKYYKSEKEQSERFNSYNMSRQRDAREYLEDVNIQHQRTGKIVKDQYNDYNPR
jgi:hypothetical protein